MKKLLIVAALFLIIASCRQTTIIEVSFKDHISYLAADELAGRWPGTAGDQKAREYIIKNFRQYGLLPFFADSNFSQPIAIINAAQVNPATFLRFSVNGKRTVLAHKTDFTIEVFGSPGLAAGEVVFIGYGIHLPQQGYDDYTKVLLAGKTVICYIIPPKDTDPLISDYNMRLNKIYAKAQLMQDLGATAAIFVLPKEYMRRDHLSPLEKRSRFDMDEQKLDLPVLRMTHSAFEKLMTSAGIDITALDETLKSARKSEALLLPGTKMEMNIEYSFSSSETANIAGMVKGKDPEQTIIIGAHHDHVGFTRYPTGPDTICNGADDNASGVAMIMQLARHYTLHQPPCNLVFAAFTLEEQGLRGSRYFLKTLPRNLNIKAMINFDLIGRMKKDSLFVMHSSSAPQWNSYLQTVSPEDLQLVPRRFYASDSFTFLRAGIPTLWFATGRHDDVHGVKDESDRINYGGLEKIYLFSTSLIDYAGSRELTFDDSAMPRRLPFIKAE